jgi:hypothetical protein
MAKLDLRALSAPLEALQKDVKAAYSRLDTKWEEITTQLKKLSIPGAVSYVYSQDEDGDSEALEFMKWKGEKRICLASYTYRPNEHGDADFVRFGVTPIEEWSSKQRIEMLEHVPELFAEAVKVTKEFIKKIP